MYNVMSEAPFALSFAAPFNVLYQGSFARRRIQVGSGSNCLPKLGSASNKPIVSLSLSSVTTQPRRKGRRLQHRAKPDAIQISTVTTGQKFLGVVCDVGPANSAWIDINVATSTGRSVRARLRLPLKDGHAVLSEKPGNVIPVYVRSVNAPSGRIEVRKGQPPLPCPEFDPQVHRLVESVTVSDRLEGHVLAVGDFGAVLDVGVFRTTHGNKKCLLPALLQRKRFPATWASSADLVRRSDVTRILNPGDDIIVWVRAVYPQTARLFVDAEPVDTAALQEELAEKKRNRRRARRRRSYDSVEIGEQLHGTVRESAQFGVFIDAGLNRDVLLHFSKMGEVSATWQDDLPVGTQLLVEACNKGSRGVEVKLVYVLQSELQLAREKASSPTANPEDLKKLQILEAQQKGFSSRRNVSTTKAAFVPNGSVESLDISQEGNDSQAVALDETRLGKSDSEIDDSESEGEDDGDDMGNDSKDADENEDLYFSDEYLEDKYGM